MKNNTQNDTKNQSLYFFNFNQGYIWYFLAVRGWHGKGLYWLVIMVEGATTQHGPHISFLAPDSIQRKKERSSKVCNVPCAPCAH